ncbi:MAG: hypothetical protein BZ136_09280 [Methanosphaera sp. rholeuAM74]|nr:MAG: hypothetical protein BZ136_09280 [Methanosphaera sp. rholeuAM74]
MKIKNKFLNTSWLRNDLLERDGTSCILCGKQSSLTVHHICGREQYPFLMNDSDNTVLLCRSCHDEYHQYTGDESANPVTWTRWLLTKRTQVKRLVVEMADGRHEELPLSQELIQKSKSELMNNDMNITIISVLACNEFTEEELIDYILGEYNTTESQIRAGLVKLRSRKRILNVYTHGHGDVLKVVG